MIDLDWIASQPKPVAIHCPTYHDVMTVLCDVNESRICEPLSTEEIIEVTGRWYNTYGDQTCVRLRYHEDRDGFALHRNAYRFYDESPQYTLVSIDQVKRKFDLGEIDGDESCLMSLFGMEVRDEL